MRRLVLAVPLLVLAACTMGPEYTRPDIPTGDAFRMAEAKDQASIANLLWWELLRDEELQKLIRIALEENRDLKRAVAAVEEFQARALIAKMDFAPQLSNTTSTPSFGRQSTFLFPGFPTQFNYYTQGTLFWEIDVWGRIRRSNEAAREDLFSKEENRRAVVLQLVGGVAEAYFDLLQFDMQLDIARRTLKAWEESVRIAQARLKQGMTSKLDADQFEAERANAAARAAELERQMVQKENQISVLLGRNPHRIQRGRALTEQVMPLEVPPGLPAELLQRRPDIMQAERELHAVTARIGVAKAERFPKISIGGILGVSSPQLDQLITKEGHFAVVGPGFTAPLFNAQVLGFQQKAVEAQAKQAVARYEQTILTSLKEVEDALVAVRTAREQRLAQVQQVDALRSALHLANLRYKGGLANYLDVLVAQRNLFEAELALSGSHRLHLVSIVQLYKSLGGGWQPADNEAKQTAS
ncbi:MAG: efflux transporter outer membrane subunit [Nitrospira sp.]|nr:efflux transporter outer membrane subunit [Nitrospira sp.]